MPNINHEDDYIEPLDFDEQDKRQDPNQHEKQIVIEFLEAAMESSEPKLIIKPLLKLLKANYTK